jgi:hypothetical protein
MAVLRSRAGAAPAAQPGDIAWLRYSVVEGTYAFVPPGSPGELGTRVGIGTLVIPDFRRVLEGEVTFKPKYDASLMVPRGQPLPPRCGKLGYNDGLSIDIVVQGFGLATFTSTAECVCKLLDRLYDNYCFAPEAQAGKLPIYRLLPSRPFPTQHSQAPYYDPKWEMVDWTPRLGHFRPVLIAIPQPIAFTPQAVESDAVFDGMAVSGEVIEPATESPSSSPSWSAPPERTSGATSTQGRRKGSTLTSVPLPGGSTTDRPSGPDPDLEDTIPF